MIIKGGTRAGGRMLAEHLQRVDTNELVQVLDVRGTAANDLDGAFREMVAVASGTRCKYPLYHASINTAAHEQLTPEQWRRSVDLLSENLGLGDQPRAVVRHIKHGREHVHIVWSRIDAENMVAISDSHNYRIHEQTARQLEQEFGLERVEGVHTGDRSQARPVAEINHAEQQQAERTGRTVEEITAAIRTAWEHSNTGGDFARELGEAGFILARGDRRAFVILDEDGGIHSPRRRLGLRAAEINSKCADLDLGELPSIEDGRRVFAFRAAARATFGQGDSSPAKDAPERDQEQTPQQPAAPVEQAAATEKAPEQAPTSGGAGPDIDRRDGPAAVAATSRRTVSSASRDETPEGVESPGLLSLIFAKVTGLFDFVREALFASAFAPTAEIKEQTHQAPPLEPEAPPILHPEPEKPKDRPRGRPYETRSIPPPPRDPARDREDFGPSRGFGWNTPPDEEPGGDET